VKTIARLFFEKKVRCRSSKRFTGRKTYAESTASTRRHGMVAQINCYEEATKRAVSCSGCTARRGYFYNTSSPLTRLSHTMYLTKFFSSGMDRFFPDALKR